MPASSDDRRNEERRWLNGIMLGVLAWGSMLALGAFLFGLDQESGTIRYAPHPLRGLITLAFVLVFLGFWRTILRQRMTKP